MSVNEPSIASKPNLRASRPRPARRTQEERSTATRRQLVQAAIDTICDRGLADATAARIASRAKMTRGAVQHHFGTRDDLLVAVIDNFAKKLFSRSDDPDMRGSSLEARVRDICDKYWSIVGSRHFIAVIQVLLGLRNNPTVYRHLLDKMQWFESELDRRWVELFQDLGISPARLAVARHIALASMRGLAIRMVYRKDRTRWAVEREFLREMLTYALARSAAASEAASGI